MNDKKTKEMKSNKNSRNSFLLFLFERCSVYLIGFFSFAVTLLLIFPAIKNQFSADWILVNSTTPLSFLCISLLYGFDVLQNKKFYKYLKFILLSFLVILSAFSFICYFFGQASLTAIQFSSETVSELQKKLLLVSGLFFMIISVLNIFGNRRDSYHLLDILRIILIAFVLTLFYAFNAANIFHYNFPIRICLITIIFMLLITLITLHRQQKQSIFSYFIGHTIGSIFGRHAILGALLIPFILSTVGIILTVKSSVPLAYSFSIISALFTSLLIFFLTLVAKKLNNMDQKIRDLSMIDDMTQIKNRKAFYYLGEQYFKEAKRNKRALSLIYIDLDGLKRTNDTISHEAGSEFIKQFASLLENNFRENDIVARIGGDEFGVITIQRDCNESITRLNRAIEEKNNSGQNPFDIKYSYGIVPLLLAPQITTFDELVNEADALMYKHKRAKGSVR